MYVDQRKNVGGWDWAVRWHILIDLGEAGNPLDGMSIEAWNFLPIPLFFVIQKCLNGLLFVASCVCNSLRYNDLILSFQVTHSFIQPFPIQRSLISGSRRPSSLHNKIRSGKKRKTRWVGMVTGGHEIGFYNVRWNSWHSPKKRRKKK